MSIDKFIVAEIRALYQSVGTDAITFSRMVEILNERMIQAVEEETATLRAEVERLKECEAIVREERERILYLKAREWVKKNPKTDK